MMTPARKLLTLHHNVCSMSEGNVLSSVVNAFNEAFGQKLETLSEGEISESPVVFLDASFSKKIR